MCKHHVKEGWKPNLTEANNALAYLKGLAAGKAVDHINEGRMRVFLHNHNIPLEWIELGQIDVMLCSCIANSKAAKAVETEKTAKARAEAGHIIEEMETSLHLSTNLALALRATGSADDVSRDIGGAVDTVADHLVDMLREIIAEREKAWRLMQAAETRPA